MESSPEASSAPPDKRTAKKRTQPRTTTACNRCRKKRGRCDGQKPICVYRFLRGLREAAGALLTWRNVGRQYELGGDKRKPYTKAVVQAMQLRIDTLEAQLAALTGNPVASTSAAVLPPDSTSATPALLALNLAPEATPPPAAGGLPVGPGPTSLSFAEGSAPQVNPNPSNLDTFQGGLAVNAHGELRFYGPTSSYRAVLADSSTLLNTPATVNAIRAFSLTRAPIPTAAPADPALPRRPPDLTPDFKAKLFGLAFSYCFAHYNIVPEREFFADLQMYPLERTQFYSPFLMNVILAVGCRYLDPDKDEYPAEICGLIGDPTTRGDVFVTWGRYLLDQEWYNPALSTIRGLLVLGLYLAGRGFDGPCLIFVKNALTLAIDFGLNLGPHRLSLSMGVPITDELITARRDAFWSAFASDIVCSYYIGRPPSFTPEMIDVVPPVIVPELDFEEPLYRSSAFHWSSRLMYIASKILTTVYTLKPGVSLQARQAAVPELHLLLESWYHELPSHLRASTTDPTKAPHPHIIVLQCAYNMLHISLHRPFFRRQSDDSLTNVSTEKCLIAASNIVRLVKLLKGSAGLRMAAPGIQHATFTAGTVLAISAIEEGILAADNAKQDGERRAQAKKDLLFCVASLKEISVTWTTASTSAGVLEALTLQWEAMSNALPAPSTTSYADVDLSADLSTSGLPFPLASPSSSASSLASSTSSLPLDLPVPPDLPMVDGLHSHSATAASLPRLEEPSYTPTASGAATPRNGAFSQTNGLGMLGFLPMSMGSSRPGTAGGTESAFGFMVPSFDFGQDGNEASPGGMFFSMLDMPEALNPPTPAPNPPA
ncbi:hypothetical protein JCM10213v2_007351 [Rhodosporidiobolus nylandii]